MSFFHFLPVGRCTILSLAARADRAAGFLSGCAGFRSLLFEKSSSKNFFRSLFSILTVVKLAIVQLGVEAALFQQGLMVALLDDVPVPHH